MSKALDWDEISCDEIRAVIADGPVFNPETPPKVRKKRAAKSNAPADPAPANEASAEQEPGEAIEEAAEPKPDFDAEVARLAELKPLEYAHISKTEAKRLGVPVNELTSAVKAHRKANADEAKAKAKVSPKAPRPRPAPETSTQDEDFAPEFTEDGLALAFAERYSERFRWVEEWHCWMEWTGTHWRKVKTLVVYDLIRKLCREAAGRVDTSTTFGEKLAADLNTAKKRAAVQTIARSDKRFEAVIEQWDANDWLLGTPGGIIDLRTGKNIGFDATKYITLTTTVTPGGECPTWLNFLDQVTKGNKELQAYLQRKSGYDLTGSTREHSLTFIYGPGGNGKGTFVGVQTGIMGELHKAADVETFAERKHPAHTTELARLHNARIVTSQETEKGQYWAEARLKKLTGGDTITARKMRCDDMEFTPKFKLTLVGNHKPKFRSVDEAIRRRLHLIPFDYKVAKADKDVHLAEKLKAEWPGILAWMVEGCLEWQRRGLDAPECVLKATDDYLEGEDTIGQWIANRCRLEEFGKTNLKDLFESWKNFCELTGVRNVGTSRNLAAELEKRLGEGSKRMAKGVTRFVGIGLKTHDEIRDDADFEAEDGAGVEQGRDAPPIDVSRAHVRTYTGDTPDMGKPLPISTHAPQAKGGNSINGGSRTEGGEQANRGARTLDASWEGRL